MRGADPPRRRIPATADQGRASRRRCRAARGPGRSAQTRLEGCRAPRRGSPGHARHDYRGHAARFQGAQLPHRAVSCWRTGRGIAAGCGRGARLDRHFDRGIRGRRGRGRGFAWRAGAPCTGRGNRARRAAGRCRPARVDRARRRLGNGGAGRLLRRPGRRNEPEAAAKGVRTRRLRQFHATGAGSHRRGAQIHRPDAIGPRAGRCGRRGAPVPMPFC